MSFATPCQQERRPARVLIFSSESSLTVVHYPDRGKVGFSARSEVDYWEGEA